MQDLSDTRKHLRYQIRGIKDEDKRTEVKAEISKLTKELGELRKEVVLCDGIAARSGVIKEKLKIVRQENKHKDTEKKMQGKEEFEDLVFTTGMGSPCSRYIVEKEIKKIISRIRVKEAVAAVQENRIPKVIRDFHPHTLRHTFATRCFENKMEPEVVQALQGHSSISITLNINIYTHVLDNKMEEEIKKFGVAKTQKMDVYSGVDVRKVRITALSHC